jgi:hypothetical protein
MRRANDSDVVPASASFSFRANEAPELVVLTWRDI